MSIKDEKEEADKGNLRASSTANRTSRRRLKSTSSRRRSSATFRQDELSKAVPLISRNSQKDFSDWLVAKTSQKHVKKAEPPRVSFLALLSYSTMEERFLMALGIVLAAVSGCSMPAWLYLLAKSLDSFNSLAGLISLLGRGQALDTVLQDQLSQLVVAFAVLGVISFVSGTSYVSLWTYTGERQALRIKERFVRSALGQDAEWYDTNNREELPTKIANAMGHINGAIGRQMPDAFANLWASVASLAVALFLNTTLALIMVAVIPVVAIIVAIVSVFMRKSSRRSNAEFASAGAIATEVISGIKTIASLTAERWALRNYEKLVRSAQERSVYSGFLSGLATGITGFIFYITYTFAFMLGTQQVATSNSLECFLKGCAVTGADVLACIYGVMLCATFFGLMTPGLQAINLGRQAAVDVFATIRRVPRIDASSSEGKTLDHVKGSIELRNVYFAYPSKPDKHIFKNFNLTIEPGTSVALVGPSGSGKSTISKLLLRFYDPFIGDVLADGVPLRVLNVAWWRNQVGYVAQEPILFPGSIRENIAVGKPDASQDDVIAAAKAACAHEFIMDLPDGYDTMYSGTSIQMSGGQMQRISIARAIVKDPAVLLLDEATSALDTNSERVVQEALENIRKVKQVTTVTVAHRLSTIMSCDKIAVISEGSVEELGTHEELLRHDGIYAELCKAQGISLVSSESVTETHNEPDKVEQALPAKQPSAPLAPSNKDDLEAGAITTKKDDSDEFDEEEEEELAPMSRLWEKNRPEWPYLFMGVCGACLVGVLSPVEAILTSYIITSFYTVEPEQMLAVNSKFCFGFLGLAAASLLGNIASACGFSVSGFRLTRRMRVEAFEAIVRRNMGWFDLPEHSTGELTSRLEEDAEAISKTTGWSFGYRVRVFATLFSAIVISLIFSWQIGLLVLGCVPLIMGAAVIQALCVSNRVIHQNGLSPGTILEQGLRGVSGVQAYNLQDQVFDSYTTAMAPLVAGKVKEGLFAGFVFGFSQFAIFVSFALLFMLGSHLLVQQKLGITSFFVSLLAVMLGAFGTAQVNADFSAKEEGQAAAARIFSILDESLDESDPFSTEGEKPDGLEGAITFKSCTFAYPTRRDHPIFYPNKERDGFNLSIAPKESVAFVGKSGCGKSTALQLVLRFYKASSGEVQVDGHNIQKLNLAWWRGNVGYVGQLPVLFAGTVRENILLGNEEATENEVIEAAKAANAHDFIMKFDKGYDTDIGSGGSFLSGGQKQRLAIARAIVKNPKFLVLDEATSALDNESERVVQAALEGLQKKQPRTTLIVAHRLVTVKECDKIAVLGGGGVKELGSHAALLEQRGLYHDLWVKQGAAK